MVLRYFLVSCFFSGAFTLPVSSAAWDIRLVDAVCQQWSGGIAGRYGSNYTFIVDVPAIADSIVPDTVWLENNAYPVGVYLKGHDPNQNTMKWLHDGLVRYEFHYGTAHDEYQEQQTQLQRAYGKTPDNAPLSNPPSALQNGLALIHFHNKKSAQYFRVAKVLHYMKPEAYP